MGVVSPGNPPPRIGAEHAFDRCGRDLVLTQGVEGQAEDDRVADLVPHRPRHAPGFLQQRRLGLGEAHREPQVVLRPHQPIGRSGGATRRGGRGGSVRPVVGQHAFL